MLWSFLFQFCWSANTGAVNSQFLKLLTNKSDETLEFKSFESELYKQRDTYLDNFTPLIDMVISNDDLNIYNQVTTILNRENKNGAPKIGKFDLIYIVDVMAPIGLKLSSKCDYKKIFQSNYFKWMYDSANEMYLIIGMVEKLYAKYKSQKNIINDFLEKIRTRMLEIIKEKNQPQNGSKKILPQDHLEIFKASNAKYVGSYIEYKSILNSNLTLYKDLESLQTTKNKTNKDCNKCEACFWNLKYKIKNFLGSNFFVYRKSFDEKTLMKLYNIYITMSIDILVHRSLYDCHFEICDGVFGAKNLYGKSLYDDFKKIMRHEDYNPEIYVSQ